MTENFNNFDADTLFKRKDNHCGYKICPRCGNDLNEIFHDGVNRMACGADGCDFIFYQNPVPAAGAIIVEDHKILLVKRAHPPKINWWCIPAGFMEWHEHPTETCVRELKEETNLDIEITSLFEIYSGNDDPRVNALLILYLANRIGGELKACDDALEVKYFHLDDLPDKIAFESHIHAMSDYNRLYRGK